MLDTLIISSSKVLAGTKFVSSNHNQIEKVFSDAIDMIQTKIDLVMLSTRRHLL
jgi:hypothetical protein